MTFKSDKYDDVYFSAEDGMAETRHVFLGGNSLPQAWEGRDDVTIAETGFGTGLNFLTVWDDFEKHSRADQRLHFISVEKHPLSKDEIREALSPWQEVLGEKTTRFLALYPLRVPGPHSIAVSERVSLTVWFGDIAEMMPEWTGQVDAWFLDGFTPSKNPDMWSEAVFANMARLSHEETTFATFTAAGHVRRGLEAAGFAVEKAAGFGRKREMCKGRFTGDMKRLAVPKRKTVAIIGGGLAGTAMAYLVRRAGFIPTIYEAESRLGSLASAGRLGMINPKLTAVKTPHSDYYTAAFANVLRVLSDIDDVEFGIGGSYLHCVDADKDRRFTGYIDNLGWHSDHIGRQGKDLVFPDGANVSPWKLCPKLAELAGATVHLDTKIEDLNALKGEYDYIVLANGHWAKPFVPADVMLQAVGGQASWVSLPRESQTHNICFGGGYLTPATDEGFHVLGATFKPWDTDTTVNDEDHQMNLDKYNAATGEALTMDNVIKGWSALRTATKDRFPIVGHVQDNVYMSVAHGSHGILSSFYAAQILLAQIQGTHCPASREVLNALSLNRLLTPKKTG